MRHLLRLAVIVLSIALPVAAYSATAVDDYKTGLAAYQQANYAGALPSLQSAVTTDPNLWQAWQLLGYSQYRLGQKTEALVSLEKCLALNPNNPGVKNFVDSVKAAVVTPPAGPGNAPAATSPAPAQAMPIQAAPAQSTLVPAATTPATAVPPKAVATPVQFSHHHVGGKVGYSIANIMGGLGANTPRKGVAFGLIYRYEPIQRFMLETGAHYLPHGFKNTISYANTNDGTDPDWTQVSATTLSELQIDYLHVPLGLHINVTPKGYFNLGGGFDMSFPLKGKLDMSSHTEITDHVNWVATETRTYDTKSSVELNDLKSPETGYYVTFGFMIENAFFEYAYHGLASEFMLANSNDPSTNDCHVLSVGAVF